MFGWIQHSVSYLVLCSSFKWYTGDFVSIWKLFSTVCELVFCAVCCPQNMNIKTKGHWEYNFSVWLKYLIHYYLCHHSLHSIIEIQIYMDSIGRKDHCQWVQWTTIFIHPYMLVHIERYLYFYVQIQLCKFLKCNACACDTSFQTFYSNHVDTCFY